MSHKVIQPEGWAAAKGYANGILTKDGTLYVGGQIGWTAEQRFESHDFIGQMEQALRNIMDVVTAAGGVAEDITRLTWYVTDKAEYMARQSEVGAVYRDGSGTAFSGDDHGCGRGAGRGRGASGDRGDSGDQRVRMPSQMKVTWPSM